MTMPEIKLPSDILGLHVMTPMEMNRQRFVLTHTVITPGALVPPVQTSAAKTGITAVGKH